VGLIGAVAFTHILGTNLSDGSYTQFATTGTQWRVYLLWSSSYSF